MGESGRTAAVVGRRTELDLLTGALRNLDRGSGITIRLHGDSGMGKTTLLDWVASSADATIIRLVGSESAAELAYTGLASLSKALDVLEVDVPSTHARVLSAAIGQGPTPGQLAVGGATLAAISAVTERSPLVLIIDDAQWLDDPSSSALAFALRRLVDEPVVTLIAERSDVASKFDDAAFETIELHGLDPAAAQSILGPGTDIAVAQRCVEASGGSPLALAQLAGVLTADERAGRAPLPSDLPVGNQLIRSFVERVGALDPAAQRAAAIVAAALDPSAGDILSAAERLGVTSADLAAAEQAGIVRVAADQIELTHPLMRTAVQDALDPSAMREVNAALAEATADAGKRAWHLASAAAGPDESVATALDQIAELADQRGAFAAAAATWERAASLSPDVQDRHRRLLAAGTSRWNGSDPYQAIAVLDEVVRECDHPLVRSDAIGIRSEAIAWMIDQERGVIELADEAQRISTIDPSRAIGLYIRAALHSGLSGRPIECQRYAQSSVEVAEALGTPLVIAARAVRAMSSQRLGDRDGAEADDASAAIISSLPIEMLDARLLPILQALALARLTQERWADTHAMLDLSLEAARHHGLASVLGFSSALQGELHLRTGRLTDAVLSCVLDVDLNDAPDRPTAAFGQAVLSRVEAVLGRTYAATSRADAAIARARRVGMTVLEIWGLTALGHASLTTGNYDQAADHLRRVHRLHAAVRDPGDLWYQGDLLEALFAIGAIDEAAAVLADVAAKVETCRSKWGSAVVRRGHGMLHGNPGDLRGSAEELAALGAPFEQARSLLLLGERHGDHEASRTALRIFERIGAEPWAAQARRIAGPVAPTSSSLASLLTNDELRVAVAIARGRSDRQVADELYLSPKTVDALLHSILPKLGVRDRAELTAHVTRDIEQTPT